MDHMAFPWLEISLDLELLNNCARHFHSIIIVSDTTHRGIQIITDYLKIKRCADLLLLDLNITIF